MDQEENTIENNTKNTEPTEAEEKTDEINKPIIGDNKSENDDAVVEQNEVNNVDGEKEPSDYGTEEEQEFPNETEVSEKLDLEAQEADLLEFTEITEGEEPQKEIMKGIQETAEDTEGISNEEEEEEGESYGKDETDRERGAMEKTISFYGEERNSITYDMGPRIRDTEEDQVFGGDFLILEEDIPLKFYKFMDEKEEEEEYEESEPEEEELIDREPYYEKHSSILKEMAIEKLKNNILQNKLAKLYKRRKMEHVLKEIDQQFDTQDKYGKKLDAYGQLTDLDYTQRTTITNELENLKADRESKFHKLNKMFEDLQNQEKDTGYGLIHTKTGKPIPDKLVERLIHRQKTQMHTVGSMRLRHIQLKNMVVEKQNAISQLDKIGENLYLMDYEQLKVENRSYMDKMEEKDDELSRLRNKCQKTIQILAHMREKSSALESDNYDLNDDLAHLNINSMGVRGELNSLKQQRDYFRNMTNKLRDESGLLTECELLRDMEISMAELKSLAEELEFLKKEHKIKAQQIRNIRKNIEFPPEGLIKRARRTVSYKTTHGRHLFKGRPSLHKPTLPEDAFNHLKHFRGKPAFEKKYNKMKKIANVYSL